MIGLLNSGCPVAIHSDSLAIGSDAKSARFARTLIRVGHPAVPSVTSFSVGLFQHWASRRDRFPKLMCPPEEITRLLDPAQILRTIPRLSSLGMGTGDGPRSQLHPSSPEGQRHAGRGQSLSKCFCREKKRRNLLLFSFARLTHAMALKCNSD